MAVVPVGADGSISVYTLAPAHVIVDVFGYFTTRAAPSGRYHAAAPVRFLDTRPQSAVGWSGPKPGDASATRVQITGRSELAVPAGASAVAITLTVTNTEGPGFAAAYPSHLERPKVSNLNFDWVGATVAATAIVSLAADGSITLFTWRGADLLVDVQGYFGGSDDGAGSAGFFVAQNPLRTFDSRPKSAVGGPTGYIAAGGEVVPSMSWYPTGNASAVLYNLTYTEAGGPGFITAYPAGGAFPEASNTNVTAAGQTVGVLAITAVRSQQRISLYTLSGGHLITDVSGWFTS